MINKHLSSHISLSYWEYSKRYIKSKKNNEISETYKRLGLSFELDKKEYQTVYLPLSELNQNVVLSGLQNTYEDFYPDNEDTVRLLYPYSVCPVKMEAVSMGKDKTKYGYKTMSPYLRRLGKMMHTCTIKPKESKLLCRPEGIYGNITYAHAGIPFNDSDNNVYYINYLGLFEYGSNIPLILPTVKCIVSMENNKMSVSLYNKDSTIDVSLDINPIIFGDSKKGYKDIREYIKSFDPSSEEYDKFGSISIVPKLGTLDFRNIRVVDTDLNQPTLGEFRKNAILAIKNFW